MDGVEVTPAFWAGRRVFLTGHTGFKGAWLSVWLDMLGAKVFGYALPAPTSPSLFERADVSKRLYAHHLADIRDLAALTDAMRAARPEIVIHMAAQSLVRESYADPVGTYGVNVMGTINLLEAVRQVGNVRAVVVVTTDKCYENKAWNWGYREIDALGGHDPYSNSKACAELAAASYRSSFFSPDRHAEHGTVIATARAGNVIGGGDWAKDRLIPDLLRAFMAGEKPDIRSPAAVRPWQHVLEPLCGYLRLAECAVQQGPAVGEGWNFGPQSEDAKPVSWIADHLAALWGEGASWHHDEGQHPHEAAYLHLDTAKAAARLGYRPRWRLDEALARVVEWHRNENQAAAITCSQIDAFMAAGSGGSVSSGASAGPGGFVSPGVSAGPGIAVSPAVADEALHLHA